MCEYDTARNEDPDLALSNRQLLDAISRTPFVDSAEVAHILGEPHTTIHRALANLLAEGIVGRVSHGTAHLPSSQRYHLTAKGIRQAAEVLGFATPSDFVRAYPVSREWLTLRPLSTVSPIHCLPEPVPSGPTWSSTAGAASTPPSPCTTAAASAWFARGWPCVAGLSTTGCGKPSGKT